MIAGVDEAGRGPLAGPVVSAAVIFSPDVSVDGIDDSKKLSPAKRATLYERVMNTALSVGVGVSGAAEIDEINILQATLLSMKRAIAQLTPAPDYILTDGISAIPTPIAQTTIKKGDSLSHSIAAASIIAKVTRDTMMIKYHQRYPEYGFDAHKGYGSRAHIEALQKFGPTEIHRKTFAPVRNCLS